MTDWNHAAERIFGWPKHDMLGIGKEVNDTCGHPCGDQVLVALAHLLSATTLSVGIATWPVQSAGGGAT
ncbi:hypothetical protein [uncultured Lamprocystis sp.]|uniref:hypothetical protein n=1 Tax=uncultured Lamprocystis sp. TaxID=543132 RepID=UPI0025E1DC51|nr:hypothetical protein [uncultured Lamprocystis sp.]